jgi:RNA polymerase sigma-70 factor (ECF subfamily)
LRWHRAPTDGIRSPQAWLVTTVTRLCIDRLRQLRAERDVYKGPWLPEPLVGEWAQPADQAAELASELSVAFLAVLERLAPDERAAFLLHEVFDTGYDDIARILGKSEPACRQIVSRARKHLRSQQPSVRVNPLATKALLDRFVRALQARDQKALLQLLAQDATWTSDGGGKTKAALKVVRGAARVARFLTGVFRNLVAELECRPAVVNGDPGLALLVKGELFSILAVRSDGQRILDAYNIMNPDKLRTVRVPESRTVTKLPPLSS